MSQRKSSARHGYASSGGAQQSAAESDDLIEDESNLQNCMLFWLDENIDSEDSHFQNAISQLRAAVSVTHVYNDVDTCCEYLNKVKKQKVILLVCGISGPQIVPRVHNLPKLTSIYVFDRNASIDTSWTEGWTKVKGTFHDAGALCHLLQGEVGQCEEDFLNISLISASDLAGDSSNQLDQSFMYTQLIRDIIRELPYDDKSLTELVTYCEHRFQKEPKHLQTLNSFKQSYKAQSPIWWYTCESFVYQLLNWALREQEIDAIIRMAFYINDLLTHIDKLHEGQKNQFPTEFTVFRGQGVKPEMLEQMKKTIGGLISFNNFLSTSEKNQTAMSFAAKALREGSNCAVLFIIKVNPATSSVPFARISDISYFKTESEILFSMLSIFRITDVTRSKEDHRLSYVYLSSTSDNDKQLVSLTERMRIEIDGSTALYRLGALMIKLGEFDKGEEVFGNLLRKTSSVVEQGHIYFQLGHIKDNQKQYDQALTYYRKTLDIYLKNCSPDHQNIATCYNNIGLVYDNKGDYQQARENYEKALEIYRKTLPEDDANIATCYSSLASVHSSLNDNQKSLSYSEKALAIFQVKLPRSHPLLATAYNNLGSTQTKLKKFSEAIASYKRAVDIAQVALPRGHHDLTTYKQNLETLVKKTKK